jgi:O-antigen ligase
MRHRRRRRRSTPTLPWPERLIEAGTVALLIFTPLAYGTVEPWAEAVAGLLIVAMAVVWWLAMLRQWEVRVELPPGWLPALLFLGLVALQSLALPGWLVQLLSPGAAALSRAAWAFTGGEPSAMPLSLDAETTRRLALKFLALALFFLVAYNVYRTRAQARRALWVMIGMGALIALFGIAQRMTWNGRFYWIGPQAPHASAFGPFVNRTHFAGLAAVVVPMALALVLAGRRPPGRQRRSQDWRARLRAWNSREAGPTSLIPWLVLLTGGAALVSGSRGGVVALLAALLAMVGLGASGARGAGRAWRIGLATALIVCAGVWIGGDILYGTIERLAEEISQPEASPRLHIWADALRLWWRFPLLGTGLGSFGVAFPQVRTLPAPVTFTHAESDWVQLLTDTGAVGLLLALASLGLVARALLRRYRQADSRWGRAFALGGLVALAGAAVQGIANFNLVVTSNLVYLALAVALALRAADTAGVPQPPEAGRPAVAAALPTPRAEAGAATEQQAVPQ